MEHLSGDIWLERGDAEGFPTVAVVVLTARQAVVVDTLTGPAAMGPVRTFLRENAAGRRLLVVNTHHHWDHVYGNAVFAGEEMVAHESCPGLLRAQASGGGDPVPPPPPEGVPEPWVTFDSRLAFGDPVETVHLIHAPGHSGDSIVVHLEREGVLLAGDALEWPLPSFGPGSEAEAWLRTIAQLRALAPRLVVPGHGPAMGGALLDANERYIAGLLAAIAGPRGSGAGVEPDELPVERFVAPGVDVPPVYRAVHAANVTSLACA